ncbi:MAG: Rid family hydrolase [Rhodospirillaceae bacterium]|nr:Rid family hydrolase [Rhodospirillaceae bacterium]
MPPISNATRDRAYDTQEDKELERSEKMVIKHRLHINPPTLSNSLAVGYSQAVVARGKMVFVAGQVGWDVNGVVAPTFEAEVRKALENVKIVLKESGARTDHVAQVRYFMVGLTRERIGVLSKALRELEMWDPEKPPAGTVIGVAALARPELNIEIELMAVVPD